MPTEQRRVNEVYADYVTATSETERKQFLDELFCKMEPYIRFVIYREFVCHTGRNDQVLELLNDAFVEVWKSLDKFNGKSKFTTWVYKIAKRVCQDALSDRKRHINDISLYRENGEPRNLRQLSAGAEEKLLSKLELDELMNDLGKDEKALLAMTKEGYSSREIADKLKISPEAARQRKTRIKKAVGAAAKQSPRGSR